jgi:hypothetical protein
MTEEQIKRLEESARKADLRWEERQRKYAEKTMTKKKAAQKGMVNYKLKKVIENDLPINDDGQEMDEDGRRKKKECIDGWNKQCIESWKKWNELYDKRPRVDNSNTKRNSK